MYAVSLVTIFDFFCHKSTGLWMEVLANLSDISFYNVLSSSSN